MYKVTGPHRFRRLKNPSLDPVANKAQEAEGRVLVSEYFIEHPSKDLPVFASSDLGLVDAVASFLNSRADGHEVIVGFHRVYHHALSRPGDIAITPPYVGVYDLHVVDSGG